MSEYDKIRDERDTLQANLEEADAAIANYREREKSFAESERLREELHEKCKSQEDALHGLASRINELLHERDELQTKLIDHKALYRHYRDLYVQSVAERDELQAKLDAIREAMDE